MVEPEPEPVPASPPAAQGAVSRLTPQSGLPPVAAGSGVLRKAGSGLTSAVKDTGTGIKVFGRLDTHVKSTIPQSETEKHGDDFYRQGQLPLALARWKEAFEVGDPHTGLKIKIELAEREMKKEAYAVAIEEARHRLLISDFSGAISRAREAMMSVENEQQRQEALIIESEAIEGTRKAAQATTMKFIFGGIAFIVGTLLLFWLINRGGADKEKDLEDDRTLAPGVPASTGPAQPERYKLGDTGASVILPKGWFPANAEGALAALCAQEPKTNKLLVSMRVTKLPAGTTLTLKHEDLLGNHGLREATKTDGQFIVLDKGTYESSELGYRYTLATNKFGRHFFYLINGPNGVLYQVDFDGLEDDFTFELMRQMREIIFSWSYQK